MIGVIANEFERAAVAEFFELFKTPWEFRKPGRKYQVLICSNSSIPENDAALVISYGSGTSRSDQHQRIGTRSAHGPKVVMLCGEPIPIYGKFLLSDSGGDDLLCYRSQQSLASDSTADGQQTILRVGYDLFQEVRRLLSAGQPAEFAGTPTVDRHIAALRSFMRDEELAFVEILPVPAGYPFIVCLTHDVDHPRVRHQKLNHTMFGFLYRAVVGSFVQVCRGRRSFGQLAVNWKAAMSLPFVFAGLARDFWNRVSEYLELEKDLTSTFFVIPLKGDPGTSPDGQVLAKRAASYELADVVDDLKKLGCAGREIGVHGINAWRDAAKGRVERERVQSVTGGARVGVRMHWLYFNTEAPMALEKAGFIYDSTVGYNETIGFRAGTTQVFKPLNVSRLLELPLHIMDTALFYPSQMNLSDNEASAAMQPLIENVSRFGGVLTTNWHDRSLGPERLWGKSYSRLLDELKKIKPWFSTAGDAVSWFQKRRTAEIEEMGIDGGIFRAKISVNETDRSLPALLARVHTPMAGERSTVDVCVNSSMTIHVPIRSVSESVFLSAAS